MGPAGGHGLGSGSEVRTERYGNKIHIYLVHHTHPGLCPFLLQSEPFETLSHGGHAGAPPPVVTDKSRSLVLYGLNVGSLGLVPLMWVPDC